MNFQVNKNCLEDLKKDGNPVIIAAALKESEAIVNACREKGIKAEAFCDSEKRKDGSVFHGLKVIHTPSLKKQFPKARILIATQQVQDVVDQLSELGYNEFYSALDLTKNYNVNNYRHKISNSFMETRLSIYNKSHEAYFDIDKTYMRSVDVMITTKCSLKCKSCSNLMQYYTNAQNTNSSPTLDAVETLCQNVDHISEFRVIGGEPLMNKDWHKIVEGIIKKNSGGQVFIYTNGTIAPKDEVLEKFKNDRRVNFVITEYGDLSKNLKKLHSQLDKFNISYSSTPAGHWIDCSTIKHHKRSTSQLKEVFKQCCVRYLYTLLNGKLYRCPFIANAANLNAIPDNPADYVDLFSEKDLKKQIKRLVKGAAFFPGCDFCVGRPYDPSSKVGYDGKGMIKAGIQTKKPLEYKTYK